MEPAHRVPHKITTNLSLDDIVESDQVSNPDGPIVFDRVMSRDKGVEPLLEAHRLLGGVLAGLVLDVPVLNLFDEVELRGSPDQPSVMDLMRTASVVVVPLDVQGPYPAVVLEAMAVGRPVVAADRGASPTWWKTA
jgi:glycosyltransferase involved in cell wall biosynthesis